MKRHILIAVIGLLALVCFNSAALAVVTKNITVSASIPVVSGTMNADISKVVPADGTSCSAAPGGVGDTWTPGQTTIAFGALTFDDVPHPPEPPDYIFRASHYYAVDVGVFDNTGVVWTLAHTKTSITSGAGNLNNNVNVIFVKQTSPTVGTQLDKVSFANSGKSYTKTQISPGWLRIYYGIANGCTTGVNADAILSGVVPIDIFKPAGTYSGSVTITLTP